MTNNSPATAASGDASASASASGDVFAAMLDQLSQDLTNGMAVASTGAVSAGDTDSGVQDGAADAVAGTLAPVSDPTLAQLLAAQQAATTMPAAEATTPKPDAKSDTSDKVADATDPAAKAAEIPANTVGATATAPDAPATAAPQAPVDPAVTPTSDAAKQSPTPVDPSTTPKTDIVPSATPAKADADVSARGSRDAGRLTGERTRVARHDQARIDAARTDDPSKADAPQTDIWESDPAQPVEYDAQPQNPSAVTDPSVQANTAAAAGAPVTVPPTPVDPVRADVVDTATAPATNQAASGVVAKGATTTPGKSVAGVASSDGGKNQGRATKASALADAGDVTRRGFASEPVVRANALPVQNKQDDADNASSSGTQPPQHNAANPASAATPAQPAPSTEPAQAAASPAPVHAQAATAPQADPSVNIATVNAGASPTQTPATPAHIAAQIQVSQHTPDVNALAVDIAAKSQDGQKHFDIRLDPAELGRVDVRLTVDDAGKAQAMLSVEKPQTLELLQKDQGHLERALKDAGLDLTQNGLSFSLKGQQQQQGQDHTPFARGQRLAARAVAAVQDITPTLSTSGIASGDTRLDIRV